MDSMDQIPPFKNANLELVAGGLEWSVEPQNSRIPCTVLTEYETHKKSWTGNDENEQITEEIGTFGLVHRSRHNDQLQISSTAIEMSIFYWCKLLGQSTESAPHAKIVPLH